MQCEKLLLLALSDFAVHSRPLRGTSESQGQSDGLAPIRGGSRASAIGEPEPGTVAADNACDTCGCQGAIAKRGGHPLISPKETAVSCEKGHPRHEAIDACQEHRRNAWRRVSGYHLPSLAQTGLFPVQPVHQTGASLVSALDADDQGVCGRGGDQPGEHPRYAQATVMRAEVGRLAPPEHHYLDGSSPKLI